MTSTSRVFAVQQPSRWDRRIGGWSSTHNLEPAKEYGKLVLLLGPGNVNQGQQDGAADIIREAMIGFDDEDYILDVGCPVARGIALVVAGAYNNGRFNLLKWDKYRRSYEVFMVDALNIK